MTRHLFSTLIAGAAFALTTSQAFAEDLFPPPWRGNPGSTFERWEFLTDSLTPAPDEVNNPWGTVEAGVAPNPLVNPAWELNAAGAPGQGVWSLSGTMTFYIPNTPWPYDKEVQLQITWRDTPGFPATGPTTDMVSPNGPSPFTCSQTTSLPNGWYVSTYCGTIIPNPPWEVISIGGNVDVDEVVIDTVCPEPQTYALLAGLGLLGFGVWRRVRS